MDKLFNLEDLIELEALQSMQDNFAKAIGVGVVTVDYKGQSITMKSKFTPFCKEVRKIPKYNEKCSKCDALGGVQSAITGEPHIYRCHMGLVDFAVPIILKDTYIGAVLAGQIRLKEDNELENIIKSTDWKHSEKLKNLYYELPEKSMKQIEASANLMYQIMNYSIEQSMVKIMNERSIDNVVESEKVYSKEIEKAINYIEKNIKKSLTLESVADHINLSTHYLSRLFKKEMKLNFVSYLTQRRIEIAKEMLLDKDIPIVNIAIDLSYNQPNYFSKVFKKSVGVTPSEYREQNTK